MSDTLHDTLLDDTLLDLDNVAYGYDAPNIVTNVNFSIKENERVALTGQNGVGKSSLLHSIMGMTPCVTGSITFKSKGNNKNITQMPTHDIAQLGIALVKQEHAIFADLSVAEHFLVLDKHCNKQALARYLQPFPELINKASNLGKNLSGGQRQQLAIALALATKPRLLLLDEPSANIQPSIVESMITTLFDISCNTGMSILIAEQNLLVIKNLTQRTYVIEAGVIEVEQLQQSHITANTNPNQKI